MKDKVINTMRTYRMFAPGDTVAVGVSGGKDSMALLHLLNEIKGEWGIELTVVHVNHGIRGDRADADERFVQQYCETNGIAFRAFHFDVPKLAQQRGMGVEECGRVLRYEAFEKLQATKTATAHTLSDRVETMLFHLARGSGSKGLSSIPPVRENIVRPLIECTGAEVLAYLHENGVPFVEDMSNHDRAYSRNLIRHTVVTQLKNVNPAFEEHVAHTMNLLGAENDFVCACAKEFLEKNGSDAEKIAALPKALQYEVIRLLAKEQTGAVPEYTHMERIAALLESGGQVQMNSGAFVRVRKGQLEFPHSVENIPYAFQVTPGEYTLPIGVLKVQVLNCKQFENFHVPRFSFAVDYDRIKANLVCRNKREGDVFFDAGRGLHKSMKKYLSEIGIAPEQRNAFPVFLLADSVIGTLGSKADSDIAPNQHTNTVLLISLEGMNHG